MEREDRQAAKARLVKYMLQGQPWHVAAASAGLHISRATAYRLLQRVRTEGEATLIDGRHGHPTKLRAPVRQRLDRWHLYFAIKGTASHRPIGQPCQVG